MRPLAADTSVRLAPVSRALSRGEPATAAIALAQAALPGLANVEAAEALALAAKALDNGVAPGVLLKWVRPEVGGGAIEKYEGEPRDYHGRWTIAGDVINVCIASGISRSTDDYGNKWYNVSYECRGDRIIQREGIGEPPGIILDPAG